MREKQQLEEAQRRDEVTKPQDIVSDEELFSGNQLLQFVYFEVSVSLTQMCYCCSGLVEVLARQGLLDTANHLIILFVT